MLSKITLFLLIFHTPQNLLPHSDSQHREDLKGKLQISVHDYHLEAGNFVEALTQVAREFRLPIGIEWVDTPSARSVVRLSWKDATVQQMLENIVDNERCCKMLVEKGIIHVFASDLIPESQNPLKLNVNAFEVRNVPLEWASRELHNVVKRTLSSPKPQQGLPGGIAGSGFSNIDDPRVSAQLKNVSLEGVLDVLALTSARKIWIVTFSDDRSLTPTGFRRTLTLWNDFPISDDDQPVWDLLHWGDAIPDTALRKK